MIGQYYFSSQRLVAPGVALRRVANIKLHAAPTNSAKPSHAVLCYAQYVFICLCCANK